MLHRLAVIDSPSFEASSANLSILEAIHFAVKAWKNVTPLTIKNCFVNCGVITSEVLTDDIATEPLPDNDWEELNFKFSFDRYCSIDDDLAVAEESLLSAVDTETNKEDKGDVKEHDPEPRNKHEAHNALDTLL